jgi:hypothetical protein
MPFSRPGSAPPRRPPASTQGVEAARVDRPRPPVGEHEPVALGREAAQALGDRGGHRLGSGTVRALPRVGRRDHEALPGDVPHLLADLDALPAEADVGHPQPERLTLPQRLARSGSRAPVPRHAFWSPPPRQTGGAHVW